MKILPKWRGFSLVELLIVVAIIGILTSLILSSLYSSRAKSRDAKRISDIAQIQLALEQYFDKNRSYPTQAQGLSQLVTTGFINSIPTSPSPGSYVYYPKSGTPTVDYIIKVTLENYNEVLVDGIYFPSNAIPTGYTGYAGLSCLNTQAGKEYCVGPK